MGRSALIMYSAPRLYEIAFDMNRKGEVDFLVHCFERYARGPVRRVVDIACGTGPHLVRLADRGYAMAGLDLSRRNIAYLTQRLAQKGHRGELVVGDMRDFRLSRPVDAAICMQDSQGHLLANEDLLAHLRAVGRAVRPGWLYVFDRYMASSWIDPARSWSWSRRRGRLIVRASFSALHDVDPVTQVFRERMTLEAVENGTRRVYRQTHLSRMVFPQELKALVAETGASLVVFDEELTPNQGAILEEELKKGNIAVAIVVGALFLAIAIIIGGALN